MPVKAPAISAMPPTSSTIATTGAAISGAGTPMPRKLSVAPARPKVTSFW